MLKLIILGGGFAGLWAAMSAAGELHRTGDNEIQISLINKDGFLVNRPRLYEKISDDMRVPLQPLLAKIGVQFVQAEVHQINPDTASIRTDDDQVFQYDRLILATGSQMEVPPIEGAEHSFNVDTWEAANKLERHYQNLPSNPEFVVIGAGFTGLELATELRSRFGAHARIALVDQNPNASQGLGDNPAPYIDKALECAKIDLFFGETVTSISKQNVTLSNETQLPADTVILASGMKASPLTRQIDGTQDNLGRLKVGSDLKVTGQRKIYAAGDTGSALADDKHRTLMSCQHAMALGKYAGHNAVCDLVGQPTMPYRQEIYRTCLDLGPWGAFLSSGWDRVVELTKAEGKSVKHQIVREWICPPSAELEVEEIFGQFALLASVVDVAE